MILAKEGTNILNVNHQVWKKMKKQCNEQWKHCKSGILISGTQTLPHFDLWILAACIKTNRGRFQHCRRIGRAANKSVLSRKGVVWWKEILWPYCPQQTQKFF